MPLPRKAVTSGVTGIATTDDTAVELIAAQSNAGEFHHARIINAGAAPGFVSLDEGTSWHYMPANYVLEFDDILIRAVAVQVKRVASGTDLSDVYGSIW